MTYDLQENCFQHCMQNVMSQNKHKLKFSGLFQMHIKGNNYITENMKASCCGAFCHNDGNTVSLHLKVALFALMRLYFNKRQFKIILIAFLENSAWY